MKRTNFAHMPESRKKLVAYRRPAAGGKLTLFRPAHGQSPVTKEELQQYAEQARQAEELYVEIVCSERLSYLLHF